MFKSVLFLVLVFNKRDHAAADHFWSLQGPGTMWSVGASAMVTLFDGGRRRVFNDEAKASYDSTVATYRETVLTGFQPRCGFCSRRQELGVGGTGRTAVARSLKQSIPGRVTSSLEIITDQTALSDELTDVNILGRRMASAVLLIEAIGGGWDRANLPQRPEYCGKLGVGGD